MKRKSTIVFSSLVLMTSQTKHPHHQTNMFLLREREREREREMEIERFEREQS
jgi:hypothetical protein